MKTTGIKSWAEDDRPREKMLLKGAVHLTNSELIAILINNGTREKTAVDVAKDLLNAVNNDLQQLGNLTVKDILKLKTRGIGEAKAISIVAALELGNRREATSRKQITIQKSGDIAGYLRATLQYKKQEVFVIVCLNSGNKVIHHEIVSEGGIDRTIADPRIILKKALQHDAVGLILCHNHPSGIVKPSRQDEQLTQKIKEAAKLIDIKLIDHIIVGEEGYYSFADEGLI